MSHQCESCGGLVINSQPKMKKFVIAIELSLLAVNEAAALHWTTGIIPFAAKVHGIKVRPFALELVELEAHSG